MNFELNESENFSDAELLLRLVESREFRLIGADIERVLGPLGPVEYFDDRAFIAPHWAVIDGNVEITRTMLPVDVLSRCGTENGDVTNQRQSILEAIRSAFYAGRQFEQNEMVSQYTKSRSECDVDAQWQRRLSVHRVAWYQADAIEEAICIVVGKRNVSRNIKGPVGWTVCGKIVHLDEMVDMDRAKLEKYVTKILIEQDRIKVAKLKSSGR